MSMVISVAMGKQGCRYQHFFCVFIQYKVTMKLVLYRTLRWQTDTLLYEAIQDQSAELCFISLNLHIFRWKI